MASFGENLRQARTARNMTLQEIAASTKISSRALQALEDEHFDQLPGGIFNKGFVRAYAHCVGLDEEKTIAEYLAAANVSPSEIDMEVMSTQVAAAAGRRQPWAPSATSAVGVLAVLVGLGMGGLWLHEQRKDARERREAEKTATAAVSPAPATAVAPDPIPSAQNAANGGELNANQTASKDANQSPAANAGVSTTAGAGSSGASSAALPANQGAASQAPQSTNQPGKQAMGALAAATPPVSAARTGSAESAGTAAPVAVSISATARVWISVLSDGKKVESLTLDPEKPETSSRSYTAKEKLLLVVGNPAGLSVTYNGKPTGVLGLSGRRATITFTPQGMEKQ